MKNDYQQIMMTATVVQSAEWHDSISDEQGYCLFTVSNIIHAPFLKDVKPTEHFVVCFGNSGRAVCPYLTKGRAVIFNGQETDCHLGKIIFAPWIKVCGMDFYFETEEMYKSAEMAQIPQRQNVSSANEANSEQGKQPKHFLFFSEVMQAVGCNATGKYGLREWLKQYDCTMTDVAVQLFPCRSTRKDTRILLNKRIDNKVCWKRGELDKLYAILTEVKQKGKCASLTSFSSIEKDDGCRQVVHFLKEKGITFTEITKYFYATEIKSGHFKNFDSALTAFCRKLKSNKFTTDQLHKIVQIAQKIWGERSGELSPKLSTVSSSADKPSLPVFIDGDRVATLPLYTSNQAYCGENDEPLLQEDAIGA